MNAFLGSVHPKFHISVHLSLKNINYQISYKAVYFKSTVQNLIPCWKIGCLWSLT